MAKFLKPVEAEPQKAPAVCAHCGWDFAIDNAKRVEYDPANRPGRTRTEPRTAISTRDGCVCDVCSAKAAFVSGSHSVLSTPSERLWRDALWPNATAPATRGQPSKELLDKFAARFGK